MPERNLPDTLQLLGDLTRKLAKAEKAIKELILVLGQFAPPKRAYRRKSKPHA